MGLNTSLTVYLLSNQKESFVNLAPITSSDKRLGMKEIEQMRDIVK